MKLLAALAEAVAAAAFGEDAFTEHVVHELLAVGLVETLGRRGLRDPTPVGDRDTTLDLDGQREELVASRCAAPRSP